jgi:D-aminoacyl-tRNA deacylase
MRIVLQRVKRALVSVDGIVAGKIDRGIVLLLGVHPDDTEQQADFLAAKCANLRIFRDTEGKMNLSLGQVNGQVLVVSQFTLFGDCSKGNRPSFTDAASPEKGKMLYDYFVTKMKQLVLKVETGIFGAMMDVELVNDGPVTLILEK